MRNARKWQVLRHISDHGPATPDELARSLGLEVHNARMLLGSYNRWGLLTRRRVGPWKTYSYDITARGRDRLAWLEGQS